MARITKFASVNLNETYGKRQRATRSSAASSNTRSRGGMLVLTKPCSGSRLQSPSHSSEALVRIISSPPLQQGCPKHLEDSSVTESVLSSDKRGIGNSSAEFVLGVPSATVKGEVYAPPAVRAMQASAHRATLPPVGKPSPVIPAEDFPALQASVFRPPTPPPHQRQKDLKQKHKEKQQGLANEQVRLQQLSIQHTGKDTLSEESLSLRPHGRREKALKAIEGDSVHPNAASDVSLNSRTDDNSGSSLSLRPQGRLSFTRSSILATSHHQQSFALQKDEETSLGSDFFMDKSEAIHTKILTGKGPSFSREQFWMGGDYSEQTTCKEVFESEMDGWGGIPSYLRLHSGGALCDDRRFETVSDCRDYMQEPNRDWECRWWCSGNLSGHDTTRNLSSGYGNMRLYGTLLQNSFRPDDVRVNSKERSMDSVADARCSSPYVGAPAQNHLGTVTSRELHVSHVVREGLSTLMGRLQKPPILDRQQNFAREMKVNGEEDGPDCNDQLSRTAEMKELRYSCEDDKRSIVLEEERRKEAARRKLLELEERMAKQKAEEKKRKEEAVTYSKSADRKLEYHNYGNRNLEAVEDKDHAFERHSMVRGDEDLPMKPSFTHSDELIGKRNYINTYLRMKSIEEQKTMSWRKEGGGHGPTSKLFSFPYIDSSGPRKPVDGAVSYNASI